MKVKNSISTTMRTLKGRETKDKAAKNIFSYKPIMGNILKYTVAEYKDCSLEEIMNCIEGDTIRTGTAFVEEAMAGSIRGEQAEFNTTDEAPAVFDILFRSLLPKKKGNILQVIAMLRDTSLCPHLTSYADSTFENMNVDAFFNMSARLKATFQTLVNIKARK